MISTEGSAAGHIRVGLRGTEPETFYMTIIRDKFDFEVGYLIKSPCKNCEHRAFFPDCAEDCRMLDKIQTILAKGVSCSRSFSPREAYPIYQGDRENR